MGAIKSKNTAFAINCVDSASNYFEETYRKAVKGKYDYYTSYINKVKEKAELKGRAEMQRWVFLLSLLLLISLLIFIWYAYLANKKRTFLKFQQEKELAATKLVHEQEMHKQEIMMADKLHKEELAHKEVQLSAMRNYLLKKIEIVEKLNSIREKDVKHFVLSEEDWAELEVFLEGVEDCFVTRLKKLHPNLTQSDIRLMMLLRLKLSRRLWLQFTALARRQSNKNCFCTKSVLASKIDLFHCGNT